MSLHISKRTALISLINCVLSCDVVTIKQLSDGKLFCDIIETVFPIEQFEPLTQKEQNNVNHEERSKDERVCGTVNIESEDDKMICEDSNVESEDVIKKNSETTQESDIELTKSVVSGSECTTTPTKPSGECVIEPTESVNRDSESIASESVNRDSESIASESVNRDSESVASESVIEQPKSSKSNSESLTEPPKSLDCDSKSVIAPVRFSDDISQRYNLIQNFIDVKYELKSETMISISECKNANELELAKVTVFILSEVVRCYVHVNDAVIQTLSHMDITVQQDLEQVFNFFINDRRKITKENVHKILSDHAPYKISSSPDRSYFVTPRRSCSSKYRRPLSPAASPSQESVYTNSPLKTYFESPIFTKADIVLKDKEILKTREILYEEESKCDNLEQRVKDLERQLNVKDKEISDLKARNRMIHEKSEECENCKEKQKIIEKQNKHIECIIEDSDKKTEEMKEEFQNQVSDYQRKVQKEFNSVKLMSVKAEKSARKSAAELEIKTVKIYQLEIEIKNLEMEKDEAKQQKDAAVKELEICKEKLGAVTRNERPESSAQDKGECMAKYFGDEDGKLHEEGKEKLQQEEEEKLQQEGGKEKLQQEEEEKLQQEEEKLQQEEKEKLQQEEKEKLQQEEKEKLQEEKEKLQDEKEKLQKENEELHNEIAKLKLRTPPEIGHAMVQFPEQHIDYSGKNEINVSVPGLLPLADLPEDEKFRNSKNCAEDVNKECSDMYDDSNSSKLDTVFNHSAGSSSIDVPCAENMCTPISASIGSLWQNVDISPPENKSADKVSLLDSLINCRNKICVILSVLPGIFKRLSAPKGLSGPNGSNGFVIPKTKYREMVNNLKYIKTCLTLAESQVQFQNNNSISKSMIMTDGTELNSSVTCDVCSKKNVGTDDQNSKIATMIQEHTDELKKKAEEIESLEEKLQDVTEQLDKKNMKLKNYIIRQSDLYTDLKTNRKKCKELELKCQKLEMELRDKRQREKDIKNENIKKLKLKYVSARNYVTDLEENLQSCRIELQRVKDENAELHNTKKEVEEDKKKIEEKRKEVEEDKKKVEEEKEVLEQKLKDANIHLKELSRTTTTENSLLPLIKGVNDVCTLLENTNGGNESILSGALYSRCFHGDLHFVNDDEEGLLNHSNIPEIYNESAGVQENTRRQELRRRNTMCPSHMQSAYGTEGIFLTPANKKLSNSDKYKSFEVANQLDNNGRIQKKRKRSEFDKGNQSSKLFATPVAKMKRTFTTPSSLQKLLQIHKNRRLGIIKPKP